MKWGIIGALDKEVALMKKQMKNVQESQIAGKSFVEGKLGNVQVVITQCGVGKVNAAMVTQILVDEFAVSHVINTGVAGGLDRSLKVGDIVVASGAMQHDFDTSAIGDAPGFIEGPDNQQPTVFYPCAELKEWFLKAADEKKVSCVEGLIATGDIFVSAVELKDIVHDQFGAIAAEMEGGAMAQVATAIAVPFLVVRSISDLADGSAPESFDAFAEKAAKKVAGLLIQMAKNA
ncbi:MAG: 5'-methylthioadenosine/adenosylhomocysteine nucleosidase [Clostridia bacterium]|nr:5'-methylthioadenosine/adenosylhomocysteine nucleosidase [Clostridia bacterium]